MSRVSTVLRALAIALVLTALPVAAAVWLTGGDEPEEPAATEEPASYSSTPLADYDTSDVTIARAGFCDRVQPEAVAEALGADPAGSSDYGNGDQVELVPGEKDVAHEYGCSFEAPDGTEARAWVFAPPVTTARAEDLVAEAKRIPGCAKRHHAGAYGDPTLTLICIYRESTIASYRGLFGDAWLSCSLKVPEARGAADRLTPKALLDRTGRWCVAAAEAASLS